MTELKTTIPFFFQDFINAMYGDPSGLSWYHFVALVVILLFLATIVTSILAFLKNRKARYSPLRQKKATQNENFDGEENDECKKMEWEIEFSSKETEISGSKIGGIPYWCVKDASKPYPTSADGHKMMLLAQINFAKERLGYPFPQKGLLQFFIDVSSTNYGVDLKNPVSGRGHCVVYHSKIDTSVKPEHIRSLGDIPISTEPSLSGSPIRATEFSISFHRRRAKKAVEGAKGGHHHLLGYPFFLQNGDPRDNSECLNGKKYDTLLFELGSEMYEDILWGNGGAGAFLINRADLLKKDFSDVLFYYS